MNFIEEKLKDLKKEIKLDEKALKNSVTTEHKEFAIQLNQYHLKFIDILNAIKKGKKEIAKKYIKHLYNKGGELYKIATTYKKEFLVNCMVVQNNNTKVFFEKIKPLLEV